MNAIEFTTDVTDPAVLRVPADIAAKLPRSGKIRVIILADQGNHGEWHLGAYEQFLRDDSEEDAIYEIVR